MHSGRSKLQICLLLMIFLFLASFTALPLFAQTDEPTEELCDFDLSGLQNLLDEAQSAFDSGDQEGAAALLEDLKAEAEVVRFACDPIPELVEETLGAGDVLTFGMPEDWDGIGFDDDEFNGSLTGIIGSDSATLSGFLNYPRRSLGYKLIAEQKVITISWFGPPFTSDIETEDGDLSAEDVVRRLFDSEEELASLSEPETLTIGDWTDVKRMRLESDEAETILYVIEFSNGIEFILVQAYAAPGQFEPLDVLAQAIIETIDYTPPFSP
jgi:hypothetical protein